MEREISDSVAFNTLDQQLKLLSALAQAMQNTLQEVRSAAIPTQVYEGISRLAVKLPQFHKQVITLEEERVNMRALVEVGQVVNSSLEIDTVLQIVMDTIIRLTQAERGFLMLKNDQGNLDIRIARNWEKETLDQSEFAISSTIVNRVANEGQPLLTTNAQEDPRFTGQQSVVAYNLRSILCVPLKLREEELIGVIYADNRIRSGLFTPKDLDLLSAFANQAAIAIANARLFASVRQTLVEVTALKNLMDKVFSSIASGVLTADVQARVMLCNRAAEAILGRDEGELVGRNISESLSQVAPLLEPFFKQVLKTDENILDVEISPVLPVRGEIDLRLSLSPLKNFDRSTEGVAIVLEDLTEKKRLEAQRRLFERMVSPAVIAQINPHELQMGGTRTEITTLFADIRGFTSFSESITPEQLVSILNRYLAAAAEAVLNEDGTVDKFLGDAVMAWFNAPVPQPDHTLRAVRSALGIRTAIEELHRRNPNETRLSFGVGIHLGDAVLGLVGTERRLDYTAIGDSVNTAKRIQENAAGGQILISEQAYKHVEGKVEVRLVEPIVAKGKREPVPVYEIVNLRTA